MGKEAVSDKVDRILALIDEGLLEHEGQTASDYSEQGPGFGVEDTDLEYTVRPRPRPRRRREEHVVRGTSSVQYDPGGHFEEVGDPPLLPRSEGGGMPHLYVVAGSYREYTWWKRERVTPLERRQVSFSYVTDELTLRGTRNVNVLVIGTAAQRPGFEEIMRSATLAQARILNDQF